MRAVKSRVWIEEDGQVFLGYGRVELLKNIEKTQSISAAAKAMNMSYKKAWSLINSMNTLSDTPLVITNTGGKSGGGTVLTDYGKSMIAEFEKLNTACETFLNEKYDDLKEAK